ncbi:MAG: thioesterase family protein [Xanthobacteraceae bacterium]
MTQASPATAIATPFIAPIQQIEPQWIDGNGHLNMAYYNVMFDRAMDAFADSMNIGWSYVTERGGSIFTAEIHVRYIREIHLGDPVQIAAFLIAADDKRIHTFQELRHATEGWLSATSENIMLHVDMGLRKTAPFPPDIMAGIRTVADAHAGLPRPDGVGRSIAMPVRTRG